MARKILFSVCIGKHENLFKAMSSPRFEVYAGHWGFEYHALTSYEIIDHEPQGYWIKFHYALKLLNELNDGDIVSFVDADISVVRGDAPLTTHKSIALSFDSAGVLNAGVFAVKVNDFSRRFFHRVYNRRDTDDHPLIDNMAVLKTYDELTFSEKEGHIEILPNYMNVTRIENELPSFNRNFVNPTLLPVRFRHFAGGQPWLEKYFDKPVDFSKSDDFQFKEQPYIHPPIHFFTVLKRNPSFIRYHIELLKQIPYKWHWHIIDAVSGNEREKEKAPFYTIRPGTDVFDDARTYILKLKEDYPDYIHIYTKNGNERWEDPLEMLNAPLENIGETAILFDLEPDELWTLSQVFRIRYMFIDNPMKYAAFFRAVLFLGEDLIVTAKDFTWNDMPDVNVRAWRYEPGMCWMNPASPVLTRETVDGRRVDIASMNSFSVEETDKQKLNYQHYALVVEEQVAEKLGKTGRGNAVNQWRLLQAQKLLPVYLNDFFPWEQSPIKVNSAHSQGIRPILKKKSQNEWSIVNPFPWLKEDWSHPINCPHCKKEMIVSVRGKQACPHCNNYVIW